MKKLNHYQKDQVKQVLSNVLVANLEDILDETNLKEELGMDSLNAVEIVIKIEEIFNIDVPDYKIENLNIVSDIYDLISNCHYDEIKKSICK